MTARSRSLFRPCIDLHDGKIKQLIGKILSDELPETLKTKQSAEVFARLYKQNDLKGGHIIKVGPGNDEAAMEALSAWLDSLQIGGGINETNAKFWIDAGASKVIITACLFSGGKFSLQRLKAISSVIGKEKLVIDISCRRRGNQWFMAIHKWQEITDMEISQEFLDMLSEYCSEFLVHSPDVEGLCQGIDKELVSTLGQWVKIPTTYGGGAKDLSDLALVDQLSGGRIDLTYGSALDIFGGVHVKFDDLVKINAIRQERNKSLGSH